MHKKHLLGVFGTTFDENGQAVEAGLRLKEMGFKTSSPFERYHDSTPETISITFTKKIILVEWRFHIEPDYKNMPRIYGPFMGEKVNRLVTKIVFNLLYERFIKTIKLLGEHQRKVLTEAHKMSRYLFLDCFQTPFTSKRSSDKISVKW